MASFSCASTRAFFFAFVSSKLAELLLLMRELRLAFEGSGSPLGIDRRAAGSLPSLLRPGTAVDVADRIRAIMLLGPLETLRR